MLTKKRILFVAESVTLAQIVRLVTLARGLDPHTYEVHFACGEFPEIVFGSTSFVRHELLTLSPRAADAALRAGRRLYEKEMLLAYIEAELRLIEAIRPELVVGDFRLTLSTSAQLAGVPSFVLINAYWSPYAERESFPVPDHPVLRWLGEELTERHFPRVLPSVFRHFVSPLNAARKHYGLGAIGSLLEVLTHGDRVLYPDDPWLTPTQAAPSSHVYLGPVLWQPESERLAPYDEPAVEGCPLVYVTLGSSGDVAVVPVVLETLARFRVSVVVATAERIELRSASKLPDQIRVVPFARGSELARRARLVVSNGGSSTGYQALAEGTPVLGLPSNLDQYLATQAIVRAGAGLQVKARRATRESLEVAIGQALGDDDLRRAAGVVAARFQSHDSVSSFRELVDSVTGRAVTGRAVTGRAVTGRASNESPCDTRRASARNSAAEPTSA